MRFITMLLGILLLAAPALVADQKKAPPATEKKAAAPKDAKSADSKKAKAKSSDKEQNDPFLHKQK